MATPLDRIWMQEAGTEDATWCDERVYPEDAEYVLSSEVKRGLAELEKTLAKAEAIDIKRLRVIERLESEISDREAEREHLLGKIEKIEKEQRGNGVFIPRARVEAALRLEKNLDPQNMADHNVKGGMIRILTMLGLSEGGKA